MRQKGFNLGLSAPLIALSLVIALGGCTRTPGSKSPRADFETASRLPSMQVAKVDPTLKGQRYSVLLNFELSADDAFIRVPRGKVQIDPAVAQTGQASLRIGAGTPEIEVKLSSLLVGRAFPANWTLLGGSLRADKACSATLTLELADGTSHSQSMLLRPREWVSLWLDISSLPAAASPALLRIAIDGRSDVWLDDVLLTDNDHFYVGQSTTDEPWSIHRRGYGVVVNSPGKFRVALDTVLARPGGFVVDEAGPLRARFSSNGEVGELTIYHDGRSYWDGQFRALSPRAKSEGAGAHESPAEIAVPEAMGRVDRRSPGDANNDGYNESRGAYQIIASAPRVDVLLTPQSLPLTRPIIEISGLPDGSVLVTLEGRLVETFARTRQGNLLVELPFKIDRPATLNVRVN